MYLALARSGIKEQVAQFGRVGFDIDGALGGPRVALKHQDLVLWATFLLDCMHRAGIRIRSVTLFGESWREWKKTDSKFQSLLPPVCPMDGCRIRSLIAFRVKVASGTVDIMGVQEELTSVGMGALV